MSSLTDTVPPKQSNPATATADLTAPASPDEPQISHSGPSPTAPTPAEKATGTPAEKVAEKATDTDAKPAERKPAARKVKEERPRPRLRRPDAPDIDVPAGQAALASVKVALSSTDDRRFMDRIVRLKNPPEDPAEAAVAVAFAVLGLSTDTRAALTSLRMLHSADPVTIGVNLGRATHSHLAEMHRVAAALLDTETSPLPGDDRAIPVVARDLVELTDAALARAGVLERIRA